MACSLIFLPKKEEIKQPIIFLIALRTGKISGTLKFSLQSQGNLHCVRIGLHSRVRTLIPKSPVEHAVRIISKYMELKYQYYKREIESLQVVDEYKWSNNDKKRYFLSSMRIELLFLKLFCFVEDVTEH